MGQSASQEPQRRHARADARRSSSAAPPIDARFLPQEVSIFVWCWFQTGQESMHTPQPLHCAGSVEFVLDALYLIIKRLSMFELNVKQRKRKEYFSRRRKGRKERQKHQGFWF
jgi:hypothetical protein